MIFLVAAHSFAATRRTKLILYGTEDHAAIEAVIRRDLYGIIKRILAEEAA